MTGVPKKQQKRIIESQKWRTGKPKNWQIHRNIKPYKQGTGKLRNHRTEDVEPDNRKTVELEQQTDYNKALRGGVRASKNVPQPTKTIHVGNWVAEDCCMLSILFAVPSCIHSFVYGVIPTTDFCTCFTNFLSSNV